MVVAVAEESRGAEHARPWIEQAKSTYWQLIDTDHRLSDLYNLVNVPQAVWIDEQGRIVRPPETAGSTDHFRRMDLKTRTMSPEDQAERLAARQSYLDAVRAWVNTGRYALPADDARAGLPKVTHEIAEAHARFRLGVWLRAHGDIRRRRSADEHGECTSSRTPGACGAKPPISTRSARPRVPTSGNACKRWATGLLSAAETLIFRTARGPAVSSASGRSLRIFRISCPTPTDSQEWSTSSGSAQRAATPTCRNSPPRCEPDSTPDETAKLLGGNYRRVFKPASADRHHTSVKAARSLAARGALG